MSSRYSIDEEVIIFIHWRGLRFEGNTIFGFFTSSSSHFPEEHYIIIEDLIELQEIHPFWHTYIESRV
jgi:hypothetical protein